MKILFITILSLLLYTNHSLAIDNSFKIKKNKKNSLPLILKADEIQGDQKLKTVIAKGNVEAIKDSTVIYADQIDYNKLNRKIIANGNIKIRNLEIGNLIANKIELDDDFKKGFFVNSKIYFNDGSYLFSPSINKESESITVLNDSIFSFCPNDEVKYNNDLAGKIKDFATIKSKKIVIDKNDSSIITKNGVLKIYNFPVLYSPYLKIAINSKKRQTGFLNASYSQNTAYGIGIRTPFFLNINPSADLIIDPITYFGNSQLIINNNFRHYTKYGKYNIGLELANNNYKSNPEKFTYNNSNKQIRWNLFGKGSFDFSKKLGLDYDIDMLSDRNYLRNYRFISPAYKLSKANLEYIDNREYISLKSIRIQELDNKDKEKSAQIILPSIDYYNESKPFFFKEKLIFNSNLTTLYRRSGLQYRRLSMVPQLKIPFNINGNLFEISSKIQGDLYSLEQNNQHYDNSSSKNYKAFENNLKKELTISWNLPLLKKSSNSSFLIEPMLNFISSSTLKHNLIPNEDSSDSELTISNLFNSDRISGYDRNEAGQVFNYGIKSSIFNKIGEFGAILGQSLRLKNNNRDVVIRGFSENNRSNIVGQAFYKAKNIFSLGYQFQIDESSYRNDINQVSNNINYGNFGTSINYLLIKKNINNVQKVEQVNISSSYKFYKSWKIKLAVNRDMVIKRNISRELNILRDGCCTEFSFSIREINTSNLIKPQKTFNFNFTFKNL